MWFSILRLNFFISKHSPALSRGCKSGIVGCCICGFSAAPHNVGLVCEWKHFPPSCHSCQQGEVTWEPREQRCSSSNSALHGAAEYFLGQILGFECSGVLRDALQGRRRFPPPWHCWGKDHHEPPWSTGEQLLQPGLGSFASREKTARTFSRSQQSWSVCLGVLLAKQLHYTVMVAPRHLNGLKVTWRFLDPVSRTATSIRASAYNKLATFSYSWKAFTGTAGRRLQVFCTCCDFLLLSDTADSCQQPTALLAIPCQNLTPTIVQTW